MDMSDDSVAAYTQLADVLNRVAPEYRDELVAAINGLIEARIGDARPIRVRRPPSLTSQPNQWRET